VRRTAVLLALALLGAGCAAEPDPETAPPRPARPAEPQHVELGWRESHPAAQGSRLVFVVDDLEVTARGWSVRVAVENRTTLPFDVETGPSAYSFGLMLFPTGDLEAAEEASREGKLPAIRKATRIEPAPPRVLRAGATWRATLSAPGSLPDGSWLRVVFGTFLGRDDPPEEFRRVVWFTDRSQRL
jgi:hypothetical protein